jgi:hypothetical protein
MTRGCDITQCGIHIPFDAHRRRLNTAWLSFALRTTLCC